MQAASRAGPAADRGADVRTEHDPTFPYAWTDRLGETFTDLDLAMIAAFFARIDI